MFVFAIETCGKTVAFTKEVDRVMHDGILNGDRQEGNDLCDYLLRDNSGLWDGVSPFTARLATESEKLDYEITASEYLGKEPDVSADESILMFSLKNTKGKNVLMIPSTLRRAA